MTPAIDALETPAVLIDLAKVEANLTRAQAYADANGVSLRPHIKTHKLPAFAKRQIALGAIGITCQKLGEAEVMADAGIRDILIPYNILGDAKLARLKALADKITLSVSADSEQTIDGYARTFAGAARALPVLVECDTGMGRCGVPAPAAAVRLARHIAAADGLEFAGLVTYPAAGKPEAALEWLKQASALLIAAGLPPRVISSGGTPDLYRAAAGAGFLTDYRPGTYIYSDRYQVSKGIGTLEDCALTVLATIVSAPVPGRVVMDAGSKTLTSDTLGLSGFGVLPAYPDAVIMSLSEEHGVIDVSRCAVPPTIGDRISIIPNHACVVSNLFDRVHLLVSDGTIEAVAVAARGRVD
jgi:D-serine deaminase-like pyridoxal phosphate-dependent protein